MKKLLASAGVLIGVTSMAMAGETVSSSQPVKPIKMTDTQLDKVVAGANCAGLVTACDVLDLGNVQVVVPVSANVCAVIAACNQGAAAVGSANGRVRN